MKAEIAEIGKRFNKARIGLKDTLAVIDLILEGQLKESENSFPYEIFEGSNELIVRTIHGTKVEHFKPRGEREPFHIFEIHTEEKETLGYLNMVYLRKPVQCYYLVYVEVLPPFRGRGLGNKILKSFKDFVEEAGAFGFLDNIILPEEPTFHLYTKLDWKRIEELIGDGLVNGEGHYMVFIPESIKIKNLRKKLIRLLLKIKKKRPIIDMHHNESMVKRTIAEFQSVNEVLMQLFEIELLTKTSTPFMRFLFTKFVTQLLGFRRRITDLLGYTGGESLEQISISESIKALLILPYSLWSSKQGKVEIDGEEETIQDLPQKLKREPTLYIEELPIYRRPYLSSWLDKKGVSRSPDLKISDLLEMGFDPTKLREFRHKGSEYIFERTSPRFLRSIEKKRRILSKIAESFPGLRIVHARIQTNPVLVILQDRGNIYFLRRKIEGIHLEEALDQLRGSPYLKEMNRSVRVDQAIILTIHGIREWLLKVFPSDLRDEIEDLTFFIPWHIERNLPRVNVDVKGVALDTVWIA